MDGAAWRAKCGPKWTTPLAMAAAKVPSPAPPLPSQIPSPLPPLPLPPSPAGNQMDRSSQQFFHSFNTQNNLEAHSTVQEQLVFQTLNLDFARSVKTELSNSFLALLSGHSHQLSSSIAQLPHLNSTTATLHSHSGGIISCASRAQGKGSLSLSENYVGNSLCFGEISPLVESRPFLVSTSSKSQSLHNGHQVAGSQTHGSGCVKPVPKQACKVKNSGISGIGTSSMSSGQRTVNSFVNSSENHMLKVQAFPKVPTEARSALPSHVSAFLKAWPHVLCMNKVGELRVSDNGRLGILCFCHGLHMSVAKFCQHSGSPSVNPGEAVYLENGMTIVQWYKLYFGNMALPDGNGWEWPDDSLAKGVLVGNEGNKSPVFTKAPGTSGYFQAVSGLGRPGEPSKKSIYINRPHTVGQTTLNNLANNNANFAFQTKSLEGHNLPFESLTGLAQSGMPLPKNNIVQGKKESPDHVVLDASNLTMNKSEQTVWPSVVASNVGFMGKFGNLTSRYPYSETKKSSTHEHILRRDNSSSKAFVADREGSSSNIDLMLGQPSHHFCTPLSSFPTVTHPLHVGVMCSSQKAQLNQTLAERSDHHRETKKARTQLQYIQSEASSSNRGQPQHELSHADPKGLTDDPTKSSLISLFLSHLNYGGYNSSESTDIVNNSMQSVTRVPDAESLSAKCNSLDHTNEAAGIEKKSFSNSFNIFDIVDAGKGPGLVATNSCNVVKANHLHDKQTADIGDLTPVIGGNGMHSTSCDIRQSSLHFNQPHNILKIRPDVSHSTQYVKAPFLGNMNHCSHAIHNSINSVSYATDEAGSLNSRTPSSFTSPNFAHIQETTCALSHQRHIDRSEKMMDEDLRFLRHMVELPKQDQCVASLTKRPQHPIVCCLSAMGSQGNVCKDLVAPEESGRGTQCSIQAHPSNQVIRSVRPCSECYSGIGVENLSAKPGPDECCNCTASAQTKSECSKEHNIQFSTCHVCGAADHRCLRFGRVLNSSSSGSVKHKMCNHKEQSPLFSGKCGCTVLPKSLGGCCFKGGDNPSDALIEQGDTRELTTPAYDEHFVFPDGKSLRVCQCECVKKHVLMKNKCHTGLWRDVPSKLQGHSDVPIPDKPAKKLEPSHLVRDLLVNTPKEFDGTQQVAELIVEQQMSSACSGSSAPAVTEVSVEVNDVDFGDMNIEDAKVMHDFVVDEGSGIEKCGSSDEATGIRECEEAMAMMEKVDPATCGYCLSSRLSGNLTDEHILKSSSKKRRTRNQNFFENITEENDNQTMQSERGRKIEKRKEQVKMNKLGVSVPESGFYSINSESPDCISHLKLEPSSPDRTKASPKSENMMQEASIFGRSLSAKRKRSVLRPRKTLSLDRSVNQRNTCGYDKMQLSNDDHCTRTLKISAEKAKKPEFSEDWVKPFTKQKENQKNGEKPLKYMSLSCIGKFHNHGMGTIGKNVRPVVCGESGIISNGLDGHQKPAKILPLKLILKKSKRCKITEYGGKPNLSSISKSKKVRASLDGEDCNEPLSSKLHSKDKDDSGRTRVKIDPSILLMSSTSKECSFDNERSIDECSVKICETDGVNDRMEKPALRHEHLTSQSKPKYKKVRKFHLSELMGKVKCEHPYSQSHGEDNSSKMIEEGNSLETPPTINIDDALVGTEHDEEKICSRFALSTNIRAEISSLDSQDHRGEACQVNTRRSSKDEKFQAFFVNSDAFCCVCGSSNQEDMNYLLECNRCLIRVHQACYGVPKIPRGYWFCRPCKINSQNIACVLCGYGGGAMTRAVKSQTVVKSLLKAWKVGTESNFAVPFPSSEIINNEFLKTSSVSEASEFDKSVSVPSSQSQDCTVRCLDSLSNNLQAYNSIVAGVLDPSVTQWVHMVCGLWTPGTRCPNVYTMSAFDVSGASPDRKKIVCSMCNRPGGSCIDCRVVDCSVQFHPWCAHQKGLLQSEIEGDDNENVGFYGRCIFHATQNGFHVDKQLGDAEAEILRSKDWTCARTEVFKGRKREDGFNPSHWKAYNDKGGCIVSQEQINAWLHINGQKTCARPVVKQGCSDIEYDFRKEYFRYKQSKGWKQLVVYKSGIHALGLYTSQFIYRGAMVVEYVGEIVGQRVADKREIEYQSGRRLQYKSACYFFRIDKEHIIDATCKGGIARFVNHSCLPNCVAKVISVRNEKKVVFFAERDIYPGEEITYDYHFNHEDEGQKIPCFCKSRNCRRYLN